MLLLNLLLHILLPQTVLVQRFGTVAYINSISRDLLLLILLGGILMGSLRALKRNRCSVELDIKLLLLQRG